MSIEIKQYHLTEKLTSKRYDKAANWPVVYLLENSKKIYIGETNNFLKRMQQHFKKPEKRDLKRIHLITDFDFNKSAVRDIEARLIEYFNADQKFEVINLNGGVKNHNYYQRKKYHNKVPEIWQALQEKDLAKREIFQLENSDLFKYSPYKVLSDDQFEIATMILADCKKQEQSFSIVEGAPGTGKTIVAMYLLKMLVHNHPDKNVGLVVSMSSLRESLDQVAKNVNGLNKSHVISPNQVIKKDYDFLIVDEAHRLKRRVNITNYGAFDNVNEYLDLDNNGNQLDWIIKSSKHQILFYDEGQSIRPTDVERENFRVVFDRRQPTFYALKTQHRVFAGDRYIKYVRDILHNNKPEKLSFENFDTILYDDFKHFFLDFKELQMDNDLALFAAGYAFPWDSKKNEDDYDIVIDGIKLRWNSVSKNFVYSKNAENEVGCIHTLQGYDLNYIGLIFGKEIDYDPSKDEIIIHEENYYDKKGNHKSIPGSKLKVYILNIYSTLMTRGMKGIYMYACNENLNNYLSRYFDRKD